MSSCGKIAREDPHGGALAYSPNINYFLTWYRGPAVSFHGRLTLGTGHIVIGRGLWVRMNISSSVWPSLLWRNHTGNCQLIQTEIPEKVDLIESQIAFSIFYLLVWLFAVAGNICVLYVVSFKQVSLSVRAVFIANLSISDILMSLTSLPVTAVSIFTRDWVFPKVFCKLIGVFQGGSIFVSSFTLTAIAVDRYFLVSKPSVQVINFGRAIAIVGAIWLVGYGLALPVGIFSHAETYSSLCGSFCEESWPDIVDGVSRMRRFYGLTVLVLQFGMPVIISSLCYIAVSRVISRQIEKRRRQHMLPDNEQKLVSRKNRSLRMMVSMVLGLVLAWLPLNLINLWRDFDNSDPSEWFSLVFAGGHVVAMTSAALNPVIYSWFNPQFRETLQNIFRKAVERNSKTKTKTATGTSV
uniref:G_PROTEIN_RECEP_F1_2 domain-containing protein n=1 Tax=Steinernema glaseri TaxID=37863 RepID=A0A1I7ZKY0_9BILA